MNRKAVSGIVLTLVILGMLTSAVNIQLVKSELRTYIKNNSQTTGFHVIPEARDVTKVTYTTTRIYMNPSDNVFDVATTPIGYKWNITFYVQDVTDLFGYQIALYYESTMINATNAWLPTWDPERVFNSKTTVRPPPAIRPWNETYNQVLVGDAILFGETFTGSGKLAIIEFQIINAPPKQGEVSIVLNINNEKTYLLDWNIDEIPTTMEDGSFTYTWSPPPVVSVINPATGDNNFIFYTNTTSMGTRFNATVMVYNVTDLFAYQVYLTMNDTLLNITRAWLPTWDTQWVFAGKTTVQLSPVLNDIDGDGSNEAVLIGDVILGLGDAFSGTGLLVVIEFEIIYALQSGSVSCSLDITNSDTYLVDLNVDDIPFTAIDGYYEYIGGPTPKRQTMVFFNINPNPATAVQTVILKGILVDEFSIPLANENLGLYLLFAGSWIYIATLKTNNYGIFTWQATIPSITGIFILAVYYPGSETYESTYNFAILIIL